MKRTVEIFTAGCPVCNPVVQLVKETACESCDVIVYDLVKQCEDKSCTDKVRKYGISRVPSVVVNGKLLDCCSGGVSKQNLVAAGIGQVL